MNRGLYILNARKKVGKHEESLIMDVASTYVCGILGGISVIIITATIDKYGAR